MQTSSSRPTNTIPHDTRIVFNSGHNLQGLRKYIPEGKHDVKVDGTVRLLAGSRAEALPDCVDVSPFPNVAIVYIEEQTLPDIRPSRHRAQFAELVRLCGRSNDHRDRAAFAFVAAAPVNHVPKFNLHECVVRLAQITGYQCPVYRFPNVNEVALAIKRVAAIYQKPREDPYTEVTELLKSMRVDEPYYDDDGWGKPDVIPLIYVHRHGETDDMLLDRLGPEWCGELPIQDENQSLSEILAAEEQPVTRGAGAQVNPIVGAHDGRPAATTARPLESAAAQMIGGLPLSNYPMPTFLSTPTVSPHGSVIAAAPTPPAPLARQPAPAHALAQQQPPQAAYIPLDLDSNTLPDELMLIIFHLVLNARWGPGVTYHHGPARRQLYRLMCVNHQWRRVARDKHLWERRAEKRGEHRQGVPLIETPLKMAILLGHHFDVGTRPDLACSVELDRDSRDLFNNAGRLRLRNELSYRLKELTFRYLTEAQIADLMPWLTRGTTPRLESITVIIPGEDAFKFDWCERLFAQLPTLRSITNDVSTPTLHSYTVFAAVQRSIGRLGAEHTFRFGATRQLSVHVVNRGNPRAAQAVMGGMFEGYDPSSDPQDMWFDPSSMGMEVKRPHGAYTITRAR